MALTISTLWASFPRGRGPFWLRASGSGQLLASSRPAGLPPVTLSFRRVLLLGSFVTLGTSPYFCGLLVPLPLVSAPRRGLCPGHCSRVLHSDRLVLVSQRHPLSGRMPAFSSQAWGSPSAALKSRSGGPGCRNPLSSEGGVAGGPCGLDDSQARANHPGTALVRCGRSRWRLHAERNGWSSFCGCPLPWVSMETKGCLTHGLGLREEGGEEHHGNWGWEGA